MIRGLARLIAQIGLGLRVEGRAHVPRAGGVIVASNHVSYADPPLMAAAVPRVTHFLAKEELFQNPLFGALIRICYSIPIRRGELRPEQMERAIAVLEDGGALIMFPEGTRSRTGEPGRPRPGIGIFAREAQVPVVPAHIAGSRGWTRGILRGRRVVVRFGEAVPPPPPGASRQDIARMVEEVMRRIWALAPAEKGG